MDEPPPRPIGAILAGGAGTRLGGAKATAPLCGRPLISYPLGSLRQVLAEVAVVAKADTALPELPGTAVWIEPDQPRHPLVGILHALAEARGAPVLVCAVDMPLVSVEVLTQLLGVDDAGAPAIVPTCEGALEPLLALYRPRAAPLLAASLPDAGMPLRAAVEAIGPRLVEIAPREAFLNVNTEHDLRLAERLLRASRT